MDTRFACWAALTHQEGLLSYLHKVVCFAALLAAGCNTGPSQDVADEGGSGCREDSTK